MEFTEEQLKKLGVSGIDENRTKAKLIMDEQKQRIDAIQLNEIKKAIYDQKPIATLHKDHCHSDSLSSSFIIYECDLDNTKITFIVPESDMGDTKFEDEMPAHLLIRWIVL